MMQYQMSSCDGVMTSSTFSVDRKNSIKMPSQDVIRNTVDHNNIAAVAKRDDEDRIASSTNISEIAQCRDKLVPTARREATPNRRRVFDEMCNHFGSQRVDPAAKIYSSLATQGSDEMCFGDLDFDADAAAFDFDEYPTTNEQPATFPEIDIASSIDQSTDDTI